MSKRHEMKIEEMKADCAMYMERLAHTCNLPISNKLDITKGLYEFLVSNKLKECSIKLSVVTSKYSRIEYGLSDFIDIHDLEFLPLNDTCPGDSPEILVDSETLKTIVEHAILKEYFTSISIESPTLDFKFHNLLMGNGFNIALKELSIIGAKPAIQLYIDINGPNCSYLTDRKFLNLFPNNRLDLKHVSGIGLLKTCLYYEPKDIFMTWNGENPLVKHTTNTK